MNQRNARCTLSDAYDTAEIDWGTLIEIALNLTDSGLSYFSMDSTMISNISTIAYRGIESSATRSAQCILQLVYGIDFYDGFFTDSSYLRVANFATNDLIPSKAVLKSNSINVYPNPSNTIIYTEIPNDDEIIQMKILDFTGNLYKLEKINNKVHKYMIDVHEFPSGIYSIILQSKSKYYLAKFEVIK